MKLMMHFSGDATSLTISLFAAIRLAGRFQSALICLPRCAGTMSPSPQDPPTLVRSVARAALTESEVPMNTIRRATGLCLVVWSLIWSWSEVQAITPKEGYKKVVLRHVAPTKGKPPQITDGLDAEIVQEYSESTTVYIADRDLPELLRRATAERLESSIRDDFDVLQLPGGHIDVRLGTTQSVRWKDLGLQEDANSAGVYILQFAGPIAPEWKTAVSALDIKFLQYIPHNGYLVAGRPAELNAASRLPFVQFVDLFHAALKSQAVSRDDLEAHDVLISVANVPEAEHTLRTLSRLSEIDLSTEIVGEDEEELRVRGLFFGSAVEALVNERLVYAVSPFPNVELSDERAAMSLTSAVDGTGALMGPGARYRPWLAALCPGCTTLRQDGFLVGMADTGFWAGPLNASGQADPGPADLPNARVTYAADYVADPNGATTPTATTFDDVEAHGTFVASILAGDPASGADPSGFLYGGGVAPSAGLLVTKANLAAGSVTSIFKLAHDARSRSVFVQNHSYNESVANQSSSSANPPCNPPAPDGKYTVMSRDFDSAVRDSNGTTAGGGPITLVVSSGNRARPLEGAHPSCSAFPVRNYTNPPATAKNVIAVGGTETPRSQSEPWSCKGAGTTSLWNAESNGKRGTLDAGWFKPDLMAPAANVAGLRLESITQETYCASTPSASAYAANTGTSFAAPVGSAAALLASRAYSATASAASPALIKAMLVMSARSMKGGKDYGDWTLSNQPPNPAPTIGALPNQSQGFGRISLQDILETYPARYYYNQADSLTLSTTWTNTFKVHDGQRPVTAVLTWTDVPAQISVGQMITNPLVNDLDLAVHLGTTCTERYVGNSLSSSELSNPVSCTSTTAFDRKNNVEYVRFTATAGATFTVTVKFETGSGGPQNFALAIHNAYDSDDVAPPVAPTGLVASGTSSTNAGLSWNAVAGATGYDVRIWDGGPFSRIIATGHGATNYTAQGLATQTTYVFDVRARNGTGVSPFSASDAATTFAIGSSAVFADDPLVAGQTRVKANHIVELRDVIRDFRVAAGLGAPSYTDSTLVPGTTRVKAVHLEELRSYLNSARHAIGLAPLTYTDGSLGNITVKAVHVQELRDALK
jgi:Fibronectin type III domain